MAHSQALLTPHSRNFLITHKDTDVNDNARQVWWPLAPALNRQTG